MPGANQHQLPDKHFVNIGHVKNTDKSHGGVTSGKGGGKNNGGTLNNIPRRHRKGGK